MKRRASFTEARQRPGSSAFTLLELCIVLLIISILMGVMMPSLHSALVENSMRGDARQLSLMVKTAMLQSEERHLNYVLDLTETSLSLRATPDGETDSDQDITYRLDRADKLLIPDPKKSSAWISMPSTSWLFQPGELCPATRVRLTRGSAWLEMSFNALTGDIEDETAYFP